MINLVHEKIKTADHSREADDIKETLFALFDGPAVFTQIQPPQITQQQRQ